MSNSIIKLENKNERFSVFPIVHHNLWKFYKNHAANVWFVEEVQLTDDLNDWNNKLTENEKHFIKNVLAFFNSSDGVVNENLVLNFYNEIELPEARQFYSMQMMIEAVHAEQYALLIDTYIQDTNEKKKLFNAIDTIPAVKKKANWAMKWIEEGSSVVDSLPSELMSLLHTLDSLELSESQLNGQDKSLLKFFTKQRPSFTQRLIAFVCVEGIFFAGSFCAIYYLKSRGLMPGLATANELISRDESMHAEFAIELYSMLEDRLEQKTVHAIFKEAINIEKEFIIESLPVSLLGMNSTLMSQYIEYVGDRWLKMLGYDVLYGSENPFGFMEMISVGTKENFFETRVSQYSRSGVGQEPQDRTITFDYNDDDF